MSTLRQTLDELRLDLRVAHLAPPPVPAPPPEPPAAPDASWRDWAPAAQVALGLSGGRP